MHVSHGSRLAEGHWSTANQSVEIDQDVDGLLREERQRDCSVALFDESLELGAEARDEGPQLFAIERAYQEWLASHIAT